ncbi:MAG: reverse transcriptase/maturase family protein [Candidatus Marinimicrobia bacterium]|nr:reverse transcriptase/maturase family protein [Candidatus Neomarinimicrobiota bacterium]
MMKRFGNIYEKVYDLDNIRTAHLNARKGKSHYREVKMIDADPEYYFQQIHDMLKNMTFQNAPYQVFTKNTDNGKVREIYKLPYFPDRIIHHCIMQVMEPIWFPTLIRDTYSAVKNRGIHDGVKRIKKALRDQTGTKYCLKMDVKKFYPSVDHAVMKRVIRKKIKDTKLLWLLDSIIDSINGLPIGNYLSQYFGNLYLSELDHWIKEQKRVRYYYRYCDDIVIMDSSKQSLHQLQKDIDIYLNRELRINLKDNWQVFPIDDRGIDFLGYRFFHGYTLLRKSIVKRFIKRVTYIRRNWPWLKSDYIISSIMSYRGWMKYANTRNLINKYIDNELFWIFRNISTSRQRSNPLQGVV